jgi:hypothetical protein
MQFKHPELLYALFLLLIPIIIHLFQLRKFQKEAFTNVAFLKNVVIQTRKSSQLKKWLTLITRLLIFSFLILAFAQPYIAKEGAFNTKKETVIYLDNSFSMQAKGKQGTLLKRAVQDLISDIPDDEEISLLTNNSTFKNTTVKAIKNELLQLDYASSALSYDAAYLKAKKLFKDAGSLKNMVFISDFQQNESPFNPEIDSLTHVSLVQLQPENTQNISVDSAFISNGMPSHIELSVILKNSGPPINNLPVSLYNDTNLIAKTAVTIDKEAVTTFSLPINESINGKISIEDGHLQFDNSLYFNINEPSKINVLTINEGDDSFLKRIYSDDEFVYTSTPINQLNYSLFEQQHLIILNALSSIPAPLTSALKSFTNQNGLLLVIPADGDVLQRYRPLLASYNLDFNSFIETEKQITTINYAHPLYNNGVFEKQVKNFQYPKVNSFLRINTGQGSAVLKFEDGTPFLIESHPIYVVTASLNPNNSNFINSPLIVPTFYNIGKQSFKAPVIYYTIGEENSFDIPVKLHQDEILTLVKDDINNIPRQQYFNNKVNVQTQEDPSIANTYALKNKEAFVQNISYNYNRDDNQLDYQNLSSLKNITLSHSITDSFNTINSDTKVNELWKWFVIFALAFLIIEMLILKYFK